MDFSIMTAVVIGSSLVIGSVLSLFFILVGIALYKYIYYEEYNSDVATGSIEKFTYKEDMQSFLESAQDHPELHMGDSDETFFSVQFFNGIIDDIEDFDDEEML